MRTNLYRLFNDKHHLLYVGISTSAIARLSQHLGDKEWAHEIAHVSVEHFDTREQAAEAERQAIRTEHPKYNVAHNVGARRAAAALLEFEWPCDACARPIEDGDGYLHINLLSIAMAEAAEQNWQRAWAAQDSSSFDLAGPFGAPTLALWQAHHEACDTAIEADDYWIDVHRIRTPVQALRWTLHFAGKGWLDVTDWTQVAHRTLTQVPGPPL